MRHSTRASMLFSRSCSVKVSSTLRRKLLALDAAGLDRGGDLLVADGVGVAEGEVFELAAHLAHAEPVGERRVDVERLAGNRFLAIGLQMLEGAHVVEPVGQLDQDHADVGDHGEQHLAHVLGLAVFAIGELDFVDFGDALDDVGDLVAEAGLRFPRWWRGCPRRRRAAGQRRWRWSPSSSPPGPRPLQADGAM